MLSGCPIDNRGYYDVPIYNEFSNKEIRDKDIITNEYQLNKLINLTVNDNKNSYIVNKNLTIPSPSLYLETDQSMAGYYNENINNMAEIDPYLNIENFQNEKKPNSHFFILFILLALIFLFFNK